MWRASKPDLSKIVTAVARIEWFVLCFDKPAYLDMFFIMSPRYSIFRRRPCCRTKHQNLPSYSSLYVETRIHSVGLNAVYILAIYISQKMQQDSEPNAQACATPPTKKKLGNQGNKTCERGSEDFTGQCLQR